MKQACRNDKALTNQNKCDLCDSKDLSPNWKGRILVLSEKSEIAKKINLPKAGEYALRIG